MGRSKAIEQSEFPYHITARNLNREWFNLPLEAVWAIFEEELFMTSKLHGLEIYAFVLMKNHFHLIARTPEANISQCMLRFMSNVSRRLNEKGNRINGNFAGRHFKTIIQENSYFLNTYKYVYRNPVEAGLAEKVEHYPFSTLFGLLGKAPLFIPLTEDTTLFSDPEETLIWLNSKPRTSQIEAIRYALKGQYFQSRKTNPENSLQIPPGLVI
jgi:putative transposase